MRKTIKINYVGFWDGMDKMHNIYYDILSRHYNVEISDDPDYIFASMYKGPFEYGKYNDCIRIFHSGEDFFPDMNLFDFAVGYDDFELSGITRSNEIIPRYFRWQYGYAWPLEDIKKHIGPIEEEHAWEILNRKTKFCNFIYGHKSYRGEREFLYEKINAYKHVDSLGTYLNNTIDKHVVSFQHKIDVAKDYKFTIAAETLRYPGMTTEKIYDAFRAESIPIYYGSPFINKEINDDAYICWDGDASNIDQVLSRVIDIDNNDELYVSMLMEQKLKKLNSIDIRYEQLEKFLLTIFDRDKEDIMQHVKIGAASQRNGYEIMLNEAAKLINGEK